MRFLSVTYLYFRVALNPVNLAMQVFDRHGQEQRRNTTVAVLDVSSMFHDVLLSIKGISARACPP